MSLTNAHALVIGVSQYLHIRRLPDTRDAEDLAGVLRDPSTCGYPAANVTVLVDVDATRARILEELDRLAQRAGPDSTVLVYFSGHGGRPPADSSDSYLMPVDGTWSSDDQLDASAISGRRFGDKLAAIRANRLTVILDCCHAADLADAKDLGPAEWVPAFTDSALQQLAVGRGRVVMAATRGDAVAYVMSGARHGLFTEHLIAGLRGAAGGDDGVVRVLDLYQHIQRNVVARRPDQRPLLKTSLEDNYAVALCQRRSPATPAAAPPAEYAYDVLVVYAPDERDSAWARSTLIRLLDERGVHVCAEELDAQPGRMQLLEIERLVSTSRYTIPVLTPRFCSGRLQELQTVMAQQVGIEDGQPRLIPILREHCEARLGLRVLVPLDMTRDENVVGAVDRLVRMLRKQATARSAPV